MAPRWIDEWAHVHNGWARQFHVVIYLDFEKLHVLYCNLMVIPHEILQTYPLMYLTR